ncbi:MAG: nitroreductase [Dehalococcoidia bacterium]|nr:MAG: nitroreductase [Dehalococcoidia bacterium]
MDVFEAIRERRSVRKYKPTPVSEEQLNAVLEAARWAPSWANTQCWNFVLVRDAETKERLAETLNPANRGIPAMKSAPIVIVACAEKGRSGYSKGSVATDKGDWFMFDVALAMQNVTLAAHALGLGTLHVGLFDAPKVAKIIDVPTGVEVVEMMPLGYPDESHAAPWRKKLAEFVFFEKYGNREGGFSVV